MIGVKPAQAQALPQSVPIGLDQHDIQPFFLEETLLVRGENGGLAGKAEVGYLHGALTASFVAAAAQQQRETTHHQQQAGNGQGWPAWASRVHYLHLKTSGRSWDRPPRRW